MQVADREGFEPSVGFHLHTLSKRARSTTPPPVRSTSGVNAPEVGPARGADSNSQTPSASALR